MIAILLIVVFLFVGWITLMIPLSDSNTIQLILSAVIGLTAVIIVSATMIIRKLDYICSQIKYHNTGKQKNEKQDTSE